MKLRAHWPRSLPKLASRCSCSTDAAVRSGAAAVQPSAPSWRSRKGTVQGRIRITEQGEVIAAKYGTVDNAVTIAGDHCVGDYAGDAFVATRSPRRMLRASRRRWPNCRPVPSDIIADWFTKPKASVTFFRQMTPINEIATLKIGSRPSSRTASDAIEDLRAIPWVFSWAQARVMLPGWYGTGQALARFCRQGSVEVRWRANGPISRRSLPIWKWCWRNRTWALRRIMQETGGRSRLCPEMPCSARIKDGWTASRDSLLDATGQASSIWKRTRP